MDYRLIQPLLFRLNPETAHDLSLNVLATLARLGVAEWFGRRPEPRPVTLMGLTFPNPVGLAAGLDKDGRCIDGLAAMGFGFLEVGTVTPRPQPGNPRPRLFRLPDQQAIINRMGFNNDGVDALIRRLDKTRYDGILGINVGKNKDTPQEEASKDYVTCIEKVYHRASYITVNLSSPNTPGLRALQFGEALRELIGEVREAQERLASRHGRRVPVVVKIAPDMSDDEIRMTGETLVQAGVDGIIATNTTLSREGVERAPHGKETGGLSGAPLTTRATEVVRVLCETVDGRVPVIASGGVMDGESALAKVEAGAALVQIYTGFIYRGPELIREIAHRLYQAGWPDLPHIRTLAAKSAGTEG
ncbi:quinone-dependent dihydroorotate dehydrogenase [Hahella sp. SMD15-11]|uniref:Dihydroorotate dehydrogenase (quinone) n=1 Tax=Thermohahella caldifontis TaxID=3142973 RepID=A0AB39UX76_9GAMM